MKDGATFLVMSYRPMIGRPESARRVRVAYRGYTLADALDGAQRWGRFSRGQQWIVRVGQPAHRTPTRRNRS